MGVKSEIANCQFERTPLQNIQGWHVFVIWQITWLFHSVQKTGEEYEQEKKEKEI
jgi:hypothetical protein